MIFKQLCRCSMRFIRRSLLPAHHTIQRGHSNHRVCGTCTWRSNNTLVTPTHSQRRILTMATKRASAFDLMIKKKAPQKASTSTLTPINPNRSTSNTDTRSKEQSSTQDGQTLPQSSAPSEPTKLSDDDEPPLKRKRLNEKDQSKKPQAKASSKVAKVEEDVDDEDVAVHKQKLVSAAKEESNTESEVEAEETEEEADDGPKSSSTSTHAKVQTLLKSKKGDIHPDWKPGEPVPYAALCATLSKIELTTKRLEIAAYCSQFLQQVLRLTPNDLLPVILLMVNKIAADFEGIELGIGESLIMKAIGETTGRSLQVIKADQKDIGDLGLVAAKSRSNQPTMFKPKPLTVRSVHENLLAIATVEGQGAQARKVSIIKKLLSAADSNYSGKGPKAIDITKDKGGPSEAKFIIRSLEGKMRLGLGERAVIVSLSQAMVNYTIGKKGGTASAEQLTKGENELKAVYSYDVIIPAMLEHDIFSLREFCKLRPGVPLKPMLAKPTKSITEVLDRFEGKQFSCEYKYDGERAQIHFVAHDEDLEYATSVPSAGKSSKGLANIFSRNSEDLSKKYPDILQKLPIWVKPGTKSFVLDCETVAWDLKEKKVLPFQQLMTRKRKDVKAEDVTVKVCVFAFDLLFLNGEALVNKSFRDRRALLHSSFAEVESEFTFAKSGDTADLDTIQLLLEDSVKASCEGLMVKMLDGPESHYEPSKRSQNWLKVKKDYLAGVGDSLDLVVLGAYFGKGKRTNVYGAFMLACYNSSTEMFETVCNIGTGFSDAMLESLHQQLEPLIIERPKPFYAFSAGNKDQPDVWFEAKYVWEVKTADLTVSPRYRAAAEQMGGKGISLRFPRFLQIREDKKPEDATTSRAVAEMYTKQESVSKGKGQSIDDGFDY